MAPDENKTFSEGADISQYGVFKTGGQQTTQAQKHAVISRYTLPQTPKVVRWTMKLSGGLIKTEKQATYALLILVGVTVIITLYLFGII